ncbi:hypothetical protein ACI48J_19780 [Paenibacillus chitinolyticus]|uniref:hypothetical protein n=1 Tax=Paenibacillus chitinolyticus TaxID=79263 RepID=UPI00386776C8
MHSFTYESKDSNHNSEEILGLLQFYTELHPNVSWLVGDLELVPTYIGDYHPSGKAEPQRASYDDPKIPRGRFSQAISQGNKGDADRFVIGSPCCFCVPA